MVNSDTRGIVVGADIKVFPEDKMSMSYSTKRLRLYAMYWDRIVVPDDEFLARAIVEKELPLFEKEGIISFLWFKFPSEERRKVFDEIPVGPGDHLHNESVGHQYAALLGMAPFHVCAQLCKSTDMRWTVGQFSNEMTEGLQYAGAADARTHTLQVALINALPVPGPDVKEEKILELKSNRRPELLAFRAALDDLFHAIEQADDKNLELVRAKEKLELSLHDLQRVFDEGKIRRIAGTVKAYLSLGDLTALNILMPAVGAAISGGVGHSPAWGALGGLAANAALTFATDFKKPSVLPPELKDFAYLYHVQKGA